MNIKFGQHDSEETKKLSFCYNMEVRDVFSEKPLSEVDFARHGVKDASFASILTTQNNLNYPIYNTQSHKDILGILFDQAIDLSTGAYVNEMGTCAKTVVGAKGIGKSACMKAFAQISKFMFPNLAVVYISYLNFSGVNSQLSRKSLSEILVRELKKMNISLIEDKDNELPLCDRITMTLQHHKFPMMILIDELDHMYRHSGKQFPVAVSTISELAFFGNQPSGMVSITVCGSSAMMEDLITTHGSKLPGVAEEFPLLTTGAVNLNGTKFVSTRIHSTLPVDLEAVASIRGLEYLPENMPLLRVLAFASGCSARKVRQCMKSKSTAKRASSDGYFLPADALSGLNTLNNEMKTLLENMMNKMYEKNQTLCEKLFSHTEVDVIVRHIATTEWEILFQPLSYAEVAAVWRSLPHANSSYDALPETMLLLSDRCWITFNDISHSRPELIYPFSLASLAIHKMSEAMQPLFSEIIQDYVLQGAENVFVKVSDSKMETTCAAVALASCVVA